MQQTITVRQLLVLVFFVTVGDAVLVLPSSAAIIAKQDTWITGLLGMAFGLPVMVMFAAVAKYYPGQSFIEAMASGFGRWAGGVLSVLFLLYTALSISAHIREVGDFLTTIMLPDSPIEAIHLIFLAVIVAGAWRGIATVSRTAELFFPISVLLFILLFLLLIPKSHLENVLPVLGKGPLPVLKASLMTLAYTYLELVAVLMILPAVRDQKRIRNGMLRGAVLGGLVIQGFLTLTILVLDTYVTANMLYPGYMLAQKATLGNFLERLEAILTIVWIITTYYKLTLYFYALNAGLAQLFGRREYGRFLLPTAAVVYSGSIWLWPNIVFFHWVVARYWVTLDLFICLVLPAALLIAHLLRRKLRPGGKTAFVRKS